MPKPDFSEFTKPSALDWEKRAIEELKGKSFDETLTWLISEDVSTDAFHQSYLMSDSELKPIQNAQRKKAGWEYVESIEKQGLFTKDFTIKPDGSDGTPVIKLLAEILKKCGQFFDGKSTESFEKTDVILILPISTNYVLNIASFRAIRYLISRLSTAYEFEISLKIGAFTDASGYKTDNPHINIVRGTTMAMSAIIGGCDYLEITPFDEKDTDFGQRIARNTSILLEEEAFFDKVADAAAGSYFIENLTFTLIQKAWTLFLSENSAVIV